MIERPRYIEKLVSYKDNSRVKIITGIRRCGKSYLLKELYASYLHLNGIDEIQNVFDIKNPIFTSGKIVKAKKMMKINLVLFKLY